MTVEDIIRQNKVMEFNTRQQFHKNMYELLVDIIKTHPNLNKDSKKIILQYIKKGY